MSDVAAEAGVSRALVSIVFRDRPGASDETRARVRAIAGRLGYQPNVAARRLAQSSATTLGVLMTLRNPFHADIVERLDTKASALGLDLILSTAGSNRGTEAALATLAGHPCAGYVLLGPTCPPEPIARLSGISPTVVIGERAAERVVDVVRSDDEAGVRLALDYLYDLGHRRIAHVGGSGGESMRAREDTYRAWMAERVPTEPVDVIPGSDTEVGGYHAAATVAARSITPTAVLAANDRCAIGLLRGLAEADLDVPDEVSVVGFDDIDMGQFGGLSLTSIHQDAETLATAAMAYLTDRLAGSDEAPRTRVFTPALKVRATTAASKICPHD